MEPDHITAHSLHLPWITKQSAKDLLPARMSHTLTQDGKLVVLPVDVAAAVLFYRKSIADACGVDLSHIPDWADYIKKAKIMMYNRSSPGTVAPLDSSTHDPTGVIPDRYALSHPFEPAILLAREGTGSWLGESGNPYEPESRFKKVLELARNVRNAGIDAKVAAYSYQGINFLKKGKVITHCAGAWMEWYLKTRCLELAGDWRVAYPPGPIYTTSGGSYLAIPEHVPRENKKDGWNIINYLCTDPDAQLIILKTIGAFPVLTTVYNDPVIFEPDEYFGGQKTREIYRNIARQIPEQKITPWDLVSMNIFSQAITHVITSDKTVDQAYHDAKTEILKQMFKEMDNKK
jgi:multiple sugar transport system substrate-binding protein